MFLNRDFSRKNTNRPDFHRLLEAAEAGQITRIFVCRIDQFSHSIADLSRVWEILELYYVAFQSITGNSDASFPTGWAMVFVQLEQETISEHVRDNYRHCFSLGTWLGDPTPNGYSLTKLTDPEGHWASSLIANESTLAALGQASLQIHFQPDAPNISQLAKTLCGAKASEAPRYQQLVQALRVGQCLWHRTDGQVIVVNVDASLG